MGWVRKEEKSAQGSPSSIIYQATIVLDFIVKLPIQMDLIPCSQLPILTEPLLVKKPSVKSSQLIPVISIPLIWTFL